MINTGQIVDFVVDKIKSFSDIFEKPLSEEVRAICNIICYIGTNSHIKAISKILT